MTIDTTTLTLMQQIQNPTLTTFSKITATITDPIVLIIISLAIATYLYINKEKTKAIFFASTITITGALITILKQIIQRPRPLPPTPYPLPPSFSFPSGHATMSIVFFGLLAYFLINKKHKTKAIITAILISLIISFTRLYLQVHWLTDVIVGLTLGTLILITNIIIYRNSNLNLPNNPRSNNTKNNQYRKQRNKHDPLIL
ncbi:MAG: phosphatase PAP2 family protein [Nanoarchaeota archaeon]|nr:phosphatase PAP2 family protein [Nanoarchaeota archaeon]